MRTASWVLQTLKGGEVVEQESVELGAGVKGLDDAQGEFGHLFGREETGQGVGSGESREVEGVDEFGIGEGEERAGLVQVVDDARLCEEVERRAELAPEPACAFG